ncbi:centromere protein S-like [Gracilinanus agilis]|uniref:centromere protein S-like n=1 Tax=Gracilinanus agilis TaxID=191870 RepID=UPI001CFC632E|nr:centromere protein S-like [Gracilinanus agilis]
MDPGQREEDEEEDQRQLTLVQSLKAAVHYTVGSMCQEAADAKGLKFSKPTIAAISEVTFRQCEHFAKDLEMFARHAKRSTINTDDVKLLARRSSSLKQPHWQASTSSAMRPLLASFPAVDTVQSHAREHQKTPQRERWPEVPRDIQPISQ